MSKSKRSSKPTPKKQKETKNNNDSLTQLLLAKYQTPITTSHDLNSQKALILEVVLSGTDEQLSQLLQKSVHLQNIQSIVGSWVQSSATQLLNRLLGLLDNGSQLWIYPWLKAAVERVRILQSEQQALIKAHLSARSQHDLENVLRLSGKLELFDF